MVDGEEYSVFSDVLFAPRSSYSAESMTVMMVRFKFDRYPHVVNRRLFLLFLPIIAGMPGFRRKIWSFCNENGYYKGIYQFESLELAEGYRVSPMMRVLERRSVPRTVSYRLLPDTLIEDYLDQISMH